LSYLAFLGIFLVPPIVALAIWRPPNRFDPRGVRFLALIAAIAFVYTTPWDNYLVWRGIWGYGNDRVLGTIGYVPIEEYLFFLLQPMLSGLWLLAVLGVVSPAATDRNAESEGVAEGSRLKVRLLGAGVYVGVAILGVISLRSGPSGAYMGLILAWAAPVLAAQWAYAGHEIWTVRRAWAIGVAVPTLYLWFADAIAISLGIWEISETYTLGPAAGSLPLEEATFFLVTNLLVTQGLILFLQPSRRSLAQPLASTQPDVRETSPSNGSDSSAPESTMRPKPGSRR